MRGTKAAGWLCVTLALLCPAAGRAGDAVNPLSRLDVTSLNALRERPPFAPTRRPPAPQEEAFAEVVVAEVAPPQLELVGVLQVSGRSLAVLSDKAAGTTMSVASGDPVDGWDVAEIGADRIVLTQGDRTATFQLFEPGRVRSEPAGGATPAASIGREKLADASSDMLLRILKGDVRGAGTR